MSLAPASWLLLLACQGEDPAPPSLDPPPDAELPWPLWEELSTQTLAMRESTGLGGLEQGSALIPVPRVGELLVPEPSAGRLWRQNAFYVVPDAGVWVTEDIRETGGWTPDEDCVLTASGLWQTGDCTGSEQAPEGWSYHHGGFASVPEGLSAGQAHEGVVLLTGPGAWVLDASIEDRLADEGAYTYLQHLRGVEGAPKGARPWGEGLLEEDGQSWVIEGLRTISPKAEKGAKHELQVLGQGIAWGPTEGFVTPSRSVTDTLKRGRPELLAWDGQRAWAWYEAGVLGWTDGQDSGLLSTEELGEVSELLATQVHGQPLALLLAEGSLHAATLKGLQREGLDLGAVDALALDPASHDLYALTGQQLLSFGSTLALQPHQDQPAQLFLAPILETPTDNQVDTDFTWNQAGCEQPSGPEAGCCALEWMVAERLQPNLDYLLELEARIVLGVNPSVLRQAQLCTERGHPAGEELVQTLVEAHEAGIELSNWTHTPHNDPDEDNPGWFIEQVGAWEPPIDTQHEYDLLHEGLVSVFDQGQLEQVELLAGSGNSVDGNHMDWEGSWVTALRDGPLASERPALRYSYFGFAGGRLDVGDVSFRKKELFPLDLRLRSHPFELGESVQDWQEGGSSSGLVYLPGTTWLVNSLDTLVPSGVWRESLYWGLELSAEDWALWQLYLRRVLAASDPEQSRVQYLHLHDLGHPEMSLRQRAFDGQQDLNVQALRRLEQELPIEWAALEEL